MSLYTGKTALIIGGTHGIGLATAKLLLHHGATVLITGNRPEPIAAAQAELSTLTSNSPNTATIIQFDITSTASLTPLQTAVETHLGGGGGLGKEKSIDLLFINSGFAALLPTTATSEESFDRILNTNTRGPFFLAQRFAPAVKPGGSILFTTSTSITTGIPGMAAYSASKAAIYSFVQTLAAEMAHAARKEGEGEGEEAVRVNAISPGYVDTPTLGVVGISGEERREFVEVGKKLTPMGRIARVEEVARAVVFMGFEATFSTGSEFLMDGGLRYLARE
ncbi:hypothetical protein FQN50_004392 [Emmonsiellopsis sp. PD_5]|nr:hypothetical protein FQN50_004392 [Emmonsiellopsis sp. PD_5]